MSPVTIQRSAAIAKHDVLRHKTVIVFKHDSEEVCLSIVLFYYLRELGVNQVILLHEVNKLIH